MNNVKFRMHDRQSAKRDRVEMGMTDALTRQLHEDTEDEEKQLISKCVSPKTKAASKNRVNDRIVVSTTS